MKEMEPVSDRSPAWPASLDASRTQSTTNKFLAAVRFVCRRRAPESICIVRVATFSLRSQALAAPQIPQTSLDIGTRSGESSR